jgi:transcription antitermination factor NusG
MRREVKVGYEVTICWGPLSGVHGTVIGAAENDRILLEVSLYQRPIVVELDSDLVQRVSRTGGPSI